MAFRYMKILFVLLMPLFVVACGSNDSDTFIPRRAHPKVAVSGADKDKYVHLEHKKISLERPRRNPFLSYIIVRWGRKKAERIKGPLECCSLELFRVMAVVLSGDRTFALVNAPDGKRYIVRRGDLMGQNGGKIIKIDTSGLKVREYERDDNGRVVSFKDRRLKILTKEEGGITAR
jgi:Tfp pilus assembly protein PilP